MGSLSTNFKAFIVLILCVSLCFGLLGCDPYADRYPYKIGSTWICYDPNISMAYSRDDRGALVSKEYLVWKGETIPLEVNFQSNLYVVKPLGETYYDKRLFNGSWTYRDGNLVLFIKEDFFFGGQYEELVFFLSD